VREVSCRLRGEKVTISDWGSDGSAGLDRLLKGATASGDQVVELGGGVTVETESAGTARAVQSILGGVRLTTGDGT
jgi:hypothetical protein